jgi:hypothetical protein
MGYRQECEAYKGFDGKKRDGKLVCNNYGYDTNKWNKHKDGIELCSAGFHACECPIEVLSYYPPADSRYGKVLQSGEMEFAEDDYADGTDFVPTKRVASELKITEEYSLEHYVDLVQRHKRDRSYCWCNEEDKPRDERAAEIVTEDNCNSIAFTREDNSVAWNRGYLGTAVVAAQDSVSVVTRTQGVAVTTGTCSRAVALDEQSAAVGSGFGDIAETRESRSAAVNTCSRSQAIAKGEYSAAVVTGNWQGMAECREKGSIAVALNRNSCVSVAAGSVGVAYMYYVPFDGNSWLESQLPHHSIFQAQKGGWIVVCIISQTGMECKLFQAGKDFKPNRWYTYDDGLKLVPPSLSKIMSGRCNHPDSIPITDEDLAAEKRVKKVVKKATKKLLKK